jgi:hypothetical protein
VKIIELITLWAGTLENPRFLPGHFFACGAGEPKKQLVSKKFF